MFDAIVLFTQFLYAPFKCLALVSHCLILLLSFSGLCISSAVPLKWRCGKYGTISFEIGNAHVVTIVDIFVFLPWFAFKLDHLCLLHWFETMIGSVVGFGALHFYWFTLCTVVLFLWMWLLKRYRFCRIFFLILCKAIGFAVFLIILIWRSLHFSGGVFCVHLVVIIRLWLCVRRCMCWSKPIPQINN